MGQSRKQASIERRNQIIDAALQVFSRKGFQATTNRDIADAAGINSPGLIYHYFDNQEDLFLAVLQERTPFLRLAMDGMTDLLEQPPRVVLTHIASTFLEGVSDPTTTAMLRLIMGEALRQPRVAEMVYQGGTVHLLKFLYGYLEQLMEHNQLRQMDPGAAARLFMGPLFLYMFTTVILELDDPRAPSQETLVETTVETFLRGMAPA